MNMIDTAGAEALACDLLEEPLPDRWAHSRGVAATAVRLSPVVGCYADVVTAAAWLHDIGYAPALHDCGFHPLDGARYLRDVQHASPLLCRLVAHHSCAAIEAAERGLAASLFREFQPGPLGLSDALIYCDMTTGPQGQPMSVEQRLAEITERYGPGHVVSRTLGRSAPALIAAADRVMRRLARSSRALQSSGPVPALAMKGTC